MSSWPLSFYQAPHRKDMDMFHEYDRLITINHEAWDGPVAPMPVVKVMFEVGLYMVIHGPGIPMTTHWDRSEGRQVGFLQFGERLIVNQVPIDLADGRVRALVQRWDGYSGWISMYSTNSMQQFVASMEGEPPCDTVADLLWPIIQRFRERPPLAFFGWACYEREPPPPPPPPSCPPWRSSKRRRV